MKLAEALKARADLSSHIRDLCGRIASQVLVQEGEEPDESPEALLTEHGAAVARLTELVTNINLTNARTLVEGRTLTALIARRDTLNTEAQAYEQALQQAAGKTQRASRSEIKIVSTIDVGQWQKRLDHLRREMRELDNTIQSQNWLVDLQEP